ncbi:MAG: hypothetical protein LZF86_190492 [Nitrospira sp.]|nr:MAG: hypothetical protein LZF86_190492 [Nitrospira sp.]
MLALDHAGTGNQERAISRANFEGANLDFVAHLMT